MTRRCIEGSLAVALAAAMAAPLAAGDYFFSEGGYLQILDEPTAANQFNLQPIALTTGSDYLDSVGIQDVLVRCSVGTGKKGVRVLLDGTVAEGEDLEPAGSFPLQNKKTRKNGYAVFENTVADLSPAPDLSTVLDPLLVAMSAELRGTKTLLDSSFECTLGVPSKCDADETTACLEGKRFKVKMDWKDPSDGSMRQAEVAESDASSARFVFPGTGTLDGRLLILLDNCGFDNRSSGDPLRFWVTAEPEDSIETKVTVTDTETGLVKVYNSDAILDTDAFASCP